MKLGKLVPIVLAVSATVPGIVLRLSGVHLDARLTAAISGTAVLGAAFLLMWACETAQLDMSQSLALAVLALVAVMPEYAVDMYFTWMAGKDPASDYPHYAVANMTGANRLLIGAAWGMIAAVHWYRRRRSVQVEPERRMEILFLGLATGYAFWITIKGSLEWYDGSVFVGIYVWYLVLAGRRPASEPELEGTAETLGRLPKKKRRLTIGGMFLFAAATLLINSEPFCEGLVETGTILKINKFVLIQLLAPIASEAPEFIVAGIFAWRGKASMGLGSLISSKVNQWTLLVGMIPWVFAISHGSLDHPIPLDSTQMHEIFLTAAQSLLAVALLASMRLTLGGGILLFVMYAGQLILPAVVKAYPAVGFGLSPEAIHPLFSAFYIVAALAIFLQEPRHVFRLFRRAKSKAA